MSTDDSYAPKSPDLSSFYSSGPTQEELHHPQPDSHFSPGYEYKAESPTYARSASFSSYVPPSLNFNNNGGTYDSKYRPQVDYEQASSQLRSTRPEYQSYRSRHSSIQDPYVYSSPDKRPSSEQTPLSSAAAYDISYAPPVGTGTVERASTFGAIPFDTDMPPRKAAPPAAPAIDPSPVRTKFPTARIKRIMQADEEVGKVAQQTPIAVGKALELFMIQLVTKSADVAREKGSKRVTAPMLKHVVEADEQWDFLRDIVSRVENEKEGSRSKAKQESSSDEEIEEPKKRTRGGRRKKAQ
ncbi:DNA polymerase epsilon subunit C [Fusarium oxysporum f. sp. cubense race 1]|uniref:NCT transcriptional regulatory complex subunit A n=1 Tax=Fusarium oxysporum f. sp. cubense (strain race 1) TaxID=1229664 RepID=N4UD99_FUSC1|nr:DNA polymerase epsilon subunit C [Fusarium oxysporum f. sp. cubense race 1]